MKKMAQKHRALLIKNYDHLYERHYSTRKGCFYCGEPAGTIDHSPPISFCEIKNKKWFEDKKIKFYKVLCCADCNRKLGDKAFFTLYERANFILSKLENKTNKLVNWSPDEIAEMSAMFTKIIKAKTEQNKILYERIRFCQELIFKPDEFPIGDY
jgi:hypothetical protein